MQQCRLFSIKAVKSGGAAERQVFGMISEIRENELILEDLDDNIRLDFSQMTLDPNLGESASNGASSGSAIYTECSFVIVNGTLHDGGGPFLVKSIRPPAIESRKTTMSLASHPDYIHGTQLAESMVSYDRVPF